MRLAIEVTTCTPTRTGVGYYTEHLVDAVLARRGPEDEVLLLSNREPAPELAERWRPHLHVGGLGVRALWMQRDVPRMLSALRADAGLFPNYAVPLAAPCAAVPVLHDLALLRLPQHFTLRKRLLMTPLLRLSAASASVLATVSEATRADLAALLGARPERVLLVPGAPHPSCAPASDDARRAVRERYRLRRPFVLTVGTLEPRKNLLTLLRAFDALDPAEHDLVVVGARGWRDRELLRELRVRLPTERVRWLGYVPEAELAALYSSAELFVYASTLEGFGLPVAEALACGAPVLTTEVPALREVAADAARYVPPGDTEALAQALRTLLADPRARASLRAAGLARAQSFSWERSADALWSALRERVPHRRVAPAPSPAGEPPAPLDARAWALLCAVHYADLFDAPLPLDAALRSAPGVRLEEPALRALLRAPELASRLSLSPDGLLTVRGREPLLERAREHAAQSRALLASQRRTLGLLATLPFVRSLCLSGGLAHGNPGRHPDIDLFVVTARDRAYTAYSLLFLLTRLTGTRALMCPNYLLDEGSLELEYHRDHFTAHQLLSAAPLSGPRTYEALCRANEPWLRALFPAFEARPCAAPLGSVPAQRALERLLAPVAPLLERTLRAAWRARLRRRAARAEHPDVVLTDGVLKLHLSDYRQRVLARFAERLAALRQGLHPAATPSTP